MNSADHLTEQVKFLSLNWYRDNSGCDVTNTADLSTGATLSYLLRAATCSIIGYHHRFASDFKKGSPIQLPVDATPLAERVARAIGDAVRSSPPIGVPILDEQVLRKADLIVPKSAKLVRLAQILVTPEIRRHTNLYLTDWSTSVTSRRDPNGLVLYRKSLTRSAIPRSSHKSRMLAAKSYPTSISESTSPLALASCLSRIGVRWEDTVLKTLSAYMTETYEQVRPNLVEATAQMAELLDFYRPQKVCLPSDSSENWIIMYQLCKSRGIQTVLYTDGYNALPRWPVLRTSDNLDWLADRVAAFGTGHREMVKSLGFPANRIDLIDPPFLSLKRSSTLDSKSLDVCVLTWTINPLNPLADPSSPKRTLKSVLRVLMRRGISRIGVKVRYSAEVDYVKALEAELGIKIQILEGRFARFLSTSGVFIGGISGAFAEATGHGASYVLFEPRENGYTDHMISQSPVIERGLVARTEPELDDLLTNPRSSWAGNPNLNLRVFTSR